MTPYSPGVSSGARDKRFAVSSLIDALAGIASPWGYLVVFALALLESAALVGLVVPGETVLVVGGFAASQGRADVRTMAAAAFLGAVVGDSIGFEFGRRLGPTMRASRLGRRVGAARWERADASITRLGGRAVLTGRFVGLLRAVVPMVAGMSEMPYRTFLVWNVLGAAVWAPAVVLAGYFAGDSLVRVERLLGRGSLAAGLILAAVALVVFAGRAATRHRGVVVGFINRIGDASPVRSLRLRFHRELQFLLQRFDPAGAFGLATTVALVIVGATAWAFFELFESVVGVDGIARLDQPVQRFFTDHRTAWLTTTMKLISLFGSVPGMLLAGALALIFVQTRRRPALATLVAAIGGAAGLSRIIKALVHRSRPPSIDAAAVFDGYAFPSGHTTAAVAICAVTAYLLARRRSWRVRVWITVSAVTVAIAVGFSRAYLGAHWLTDVVGGLLVGGAWSVAIIAVSREIALRTERSAPDQMTPADT